MSADPLETYLKQLRGRLRCEEQFFIARQFRLESALGKVEADEISYLGIIREHQPYLDQVLTHPFVAVIGDPGSGKSMVVSEIACRLTGGQGDHVPILGYLRGYRGSLADLLKDVPDFIRNPQDLKRFYLFDGFDEIPPDYLPAFANEVAELLGNEPASQILITSRQAFFVEHGGSLPSKFRVFRLLDFQEQDIRRYATLSGLQPNEFWDALQDARCANEARNPLAAKALVERFRSSKRLSGLVTDNVNYLVDEFIRSRPAIHALRQRRALRMLAITMETYSRNELTRHEAKKVLMISMGVSESEAERFVDELLQSILVQTSGGIAFQLPSYGEYLAAEELYDKGMDRVRELAFLPNGAPNDSWRNTIRLLIEINPEVRRYFAEIHPEWLLGISASVLTDREKDALLFRLLDEIESEGRFVVNHATIHAAKLAEFVTDEGAVRLRGGLSNAKTNVRGNAIVLLGLRKDPSVIPVALAIATDSQRTDSLRMCAFLALGSCGASSVVDQLLSALTPTDPLREHLIDCMGSVMSADQIPRVLPLVLSAENIESGTFYRMRELRTRDGLLFSLQCLLEHPDLLMNLRTKSYIEPVIEELSEFMDAALLEVCARLIVAVEEARIWARHGGITKTFVQQLTASGQQGQVAILVFRAMIERGLRPFHTADICANLIDPDALQWLQAHRPTEIIDSVFGWIRDEGSRNALASLLTRPIQAPDPEIERWNREEADRQRQFAEEKARATADVHNAQSIDSVLKGFAALGKDNWPELEGRRLTWLANAFAELLQRLDLATSIAQIDEHSWSRPPVIDLVMMLVEFYDLALDDDVPVVYTIRAFSGSAASKYYERHGFSDRARNVFESLLGDATMTNRLRANLYSFLNQTDCRSKGTADFLQDLVSRRNLEQWLREGALQMLLDRFGEIDLVNAIYRNSSDPLSEKAFELLVAHQHRPTVERELQRLIDNPQLLIDAEKPWPTETDLKWIGVIRLGDVWRKLVKLRELTLRNNLPNLAGLLSETLAKADIRQVGSVVRQQLADAPESWRVHLMNRADEYDREARLQEARATPFDVVIAKLKGTTSMISLKVWVEGKTDRPVYKTFLAKRGLSIPVIFDSFGGWGNLVTKEPERLRDGCRAVIVIADGDVTRQLRKRKRPLTAQAKKIGGDLARIGIPLHALMRASIESYFVREACERVLRRDLQHYFPIPHDVRCTEHFVEIPSRYRIVRNIRQLVMRIFGRKNPCFFDKELNGQIAEGMSEADVRGTDLEAILGEIESTAKRISA